MNLEAYLKFIMKNPMTPDKIIEERFGEELTPVHEGFSRVCHEITEAGKLFLEGKNGPVK